MRLLVCGSRTWRDEDLIADVLSDYAAERDVEVIHGAQVSVGPDGERFGADYLADRVAKLYGFQVRAFPANWKRGRKAGPERNRRMLDEAPDKVIAFWDGRSRGTGGTIAEARRRAIPVEIVPPYEERRSS